MCGRMDFIRTAIIAWIIALSLFAVFEAERRPERMLCRKDACSNARLVEIFHAKSI